jgi:uncharacterized protein YdhG (YjbR/CyaY superfamily)
MAAQPEALPPKLEQVRAAIRRAVPEAVEGIGYRMPGYKLHRKPMLYFAGFQERYSLFAVSGTLLAALEDELRGYELRKGTRDGFPAPLVLPVTDTGLPANSATSLVLVVAGVMAISPSRWSKSLTAVMNAQTAGGRIYWTMA